MLVHQIQESEGTVGDAVKLSSRNIDNEIGSGDCNAGIRLASNGVAFIKNANNSNSQITGEWLVSGDPSIFYVQRTIISGSLDSDPGAGFLQLTSTREYAILQSGAGNKDAVVFLEISDNASGVPVVENATITMSCQVEM